MWNQKDAICRVVYTQYKKAKDPGLVLSGAPCGDGKVCLINCNNGKLLGLTVREEVK